MAYTAGRGWIEYLRIDTVEANDVFGLRLNVWTSIVVFLGATAYFVVVGRRHPGREESRASREAADEPAGSTATTAEGGDHARSGEACPSMKSAPRLGSFRP